MPTDAALLVALTRYRVVADAFKSADRVAWADTAIAKIGADQQDGPVPWSIYETTMVRDELATLVQALERYNDACIALTA
jgi:hypothetical protein